MCTTRQEFRRTRLAFKNEFFTSVSDLISFFFIPGADFQIATRHAVPAAVVRSWYPPSSALEPEDNVDDVTLSESSDDDPPPLPSIQPMLRRSLRHKSEEEVEQDIISISGRSSFQSFLLYQIFNIFYLDDDAPDGARAATEEAATPPGEPVADLFSSFLHLGDENPWN
jgi:hypothetical protein